MKKNAILLTLLLSLSYIVSSAQTVMPVEASVEDYIALLNQKGYMAYSYDISQLKDTTYHIKFEIREYVAGNPDPIKVKSYGRGLKNRTMVKEFMWKERSDEELAEIRSASVDYDNGIYSCSGKITVGFLPCTNDSTAVGRVFVENQGSFGFNLALKPVNHEGAFDNDVVYKYKPIPFTASAFEEGKYIPLVSYASFWYDSKFKIIRFCGAAELDPDMTTYILKETPHYYVIGVIFNKAD
ncbi:MAG: DUF5041 domain-containing protein [Candidatus Cryptobacteroides sp.]